MSDGSGSNNNNNNSGEVVKLVDHVPPRREKEYYNGVEITYSFDMPTRRWKWHFNIPSVVAFSDDADTLEKAKKAAHKMLDTAKGED